jgi:hypothetical protein
MSARALVLFFAGVVAMPSGANALASPEATFREHKAAWIQKDIRRFLATISFRQEAHEDLNRQGTAPSETAVAELAAAKEAQLRTLLETRGFIATDIGTCDIAKKISLTDDQVRLILTCTSPKSFLMLPLRVMRFPNGWLVVRGGRPDA